MWEHYRYVSMLCHFVIITVHFCPRFEGFQGEERGGKEKREKEKREKKRGKKGKEKKKECTTGKIWCGRNSGRPIEICSVES